MIDRSLQPCYQRGQAGANLIAVAGGLIDSEPIVKNLDIPTLLAAFRGIENYFHLQSYHVRWRPWELHGFGCK